MNRNRHIVSYPSQLALMIGLLLGCVVASGDEIRSPFERASEAPVVENPKNQAPTRLDKVEFTGLLSVGGDVTISLYDTESKQSVWVPLDGSEDGFSVSGFNELDGTISVSLDGNTRQIPINENEIVAVSRAATPRNPAPEKPAKPVRVKDPETLQKEEEARLFVSNLLANGMKAREKYRREREASLSRAAGKDQ